MEDDYFEEEEKKEELRQKTSFFWEWLAVFISFCLVGALIIIPAIILTGWFWLILLFILPPIFFGSVLFKHRLIVDQKHAVVFEWHGERVAPLGPGIYFPFPFWGFLSNGVEVPTNNKVLHIFTGSRQGMSEQEQQKYYGMDRNVQPETGAALGLLYDAVVRVIEPVKFVYNFDDAYSQLASLVEKEVVAYVHSEKAEDIYDHFFDKDWQKLIVDKLKEEISNNLGLDFSSFIPKGLIDSPEVEASRSAVELEKRNGEVLKAKLENQRARQQIAEKENEMRAAAIQSIMTSANCSAAEALAYLNQEKTLATVREAKNIGTYISGNNRVTEGAAFGLGFNSGSSGNSKEVTR